MLRIKAVTATGIFLISAFAFAGSAFSQAPSSAEGVQYGSILTGIIDALFPIVAALATYLINANVKNKQMSDLLSNAVQNSLGVVKKNINKDIMARNPTLTTGHQAIDAGVAYVFRHADEAIKHFNMSDDKDKIAQKIIAKLGLAEIETNLATTASPAPIISGPLAPVATTEIRQS